MGVSWDWCSLFQKDANDFRTKEEWRLFGQALKTMGLWYCHPKTVVYLMTEQVKLEVDYAKRGWTLFERSLAELVKPSYGGFVDWIHVRGSRGF